jgi:microcystin-dependent protein
MSPGGAAGSFAGNAALTSKNGTGIGIYAAGTGIGIYAAGTGMSNVAATCGLGMYNAGGGAAHNNMPPFATVTYMIKVLPN